MVFTMRYCKNSTSERRGGPARARACAAIFLLLIGFCAAFFVPGAHAQALAAGTTLEVERDADGVYLSATLAFALPRAVEDALEKGIPINFIAEADLVRERWYWLDRQVAAVHRYLRVSYQPLTRRWRLSVSSTPFDPTGLGVSVGQTYDQLSEVLAALQRIARWKVADAAELNDHQAYRLQFRFQLDTSQLPRPLQIGALGRSDWTLSVARSERVPALQAP